jgi:GNAT superfamily N-acetyltransferase
MTIQIFTYSNEEITRGEQDQLARFSLWYEDLEEALVIKTILAWDGGQIVGFQTINSENLCVAIEVADEYLGQGIARLMIEESGCYQPENNSFPEFWEAVAKWDCIF